MTIDHSKYATKLTIFEQNSTEILSSLTVGQIVRISINVNGTSPNPDPNVVRLNTCHVEDGERKVQIVENGEPVSLFSSAVWILGSESNTASFHFRVFTIGNAETGKFSCQGINSIILSPYIVLRLRWVVFSCITGFK